MCSGRQSREEERINEKKGEEEEEVLDGSGLCSFTLGAAASAVSDGEEINMSLTICTPIHLPAQHTAHACVQPPAAASVTAGVYPAFNKLLSSVT